MRPLHGKPASKEGKRGYGECEIVLILEQNIVARFVCINEYGHRLTFGIFYYVKYCDRIEIQCGAFFHTVTKYVNCILTKFVQFDFLRFCRVLTSVPGLRCGRAYGSVCHFFFLLC